MTLLVIPVQWSADALGRAVGAVSYAVGSHGVAVGTVSVILNGWVDCGLGYLRWRLRFGLLEQTRASHKAMKPGYGCLETVVKCVESDAVAARYALLDSWLRGGSPFVLACILMISSHV